jgi:hypothetical protein
MLAKLSLRLKPLIIRSETDVAKKKTTIITSETQEIFVIRRPVTQMRETWCGGCSAEVELLKPEEAAAIAGVSTRTIYAWLEAGQIHNMETPEGNVLVCPKCLWRRRAQ